MHSGATTKMVFAPTDGLPGHDGGFGMRNSR